MHITFYVKETKQKHPSSMNVVFLMTYNTDFLSLGGIKSSIVIKYAVNILAI